MKYFPKLILVLSIVFTFVSCNEYKLFEKELSKEKIQLAKLYSNYASVGYANGLFYGRYNLEFSNGDTLNKRIVQKSESRLFVCDTAGIVKKDFLLKTTNFFYNTFDVLPNNEFVFISNNNLNYSEGQVIKEVPITIPKTAYINKIIALDNDKVVYFINNNSKKIVQVLDFKNNKIIAEKQFEDLNYNANLFADKINKKIFFVNTTSNGSVVIEQFDINLKSLNKFETVVEVKNANNYSISINHKNFKNDNYFLINNNFNGYLIKLNEGKVVASVVVPYNNCNFSNSESSNKLTIVFNSNGVYNQLYFNDNLQSDFDNPLKVDSFDSSNPNNTFTYFDSPNGKKIGYLIGSNQNNYGREKFKVYIKKRFFNEIKSNDKTIFMSDFRPIANRWGW